jgi:NAD(P)-dependent dehydrogenase (short-subunit alcohol dehydrogenase family)
MADRLKDKVALVVGAGSIGPGWGNGKAAAVAFAREGARVFCADINHAAAEETVGLIRAEGGEATAHCCDVSKGADVAAMVEACRSTYDRIDILDNNVGIAEVGGVEKSAGLAESYAGGDVEEMWRVRDRQVPMGFGGDAWPLCHRNPAYRRRRSHAQIRLSLPS